MKSVSLRHMQHHLSEVMRHVDQGQEVLVTRRRRTIARLAPATPAATRVKWPDFAARTAKASALVAAKAPALVAARIKGAPLSATILAERD